MSSEIFFCPVPCILYKAMESQMSKVSNDQTVSLITVFESQAIVLPFHHDFVPQRIKGSGLDVVFAAIVSCSFLLSVF